MHLSPAEVCLPEPETAPPSSPPEPRPGTRSLRVPAIAAIALLLVAVVLVEVFRHGATSRGTPAPGSASAIGAEPALRLYGTTEAVHMRAIVAPMLASESFGTLTVTRLAASGTRVRKGDLLAEFDRQAQMRQFMDKQAEYVDFANKTAEAQAKEVADRAKGETEIGQAESGWSKAGLEMQKVELLSKIDAEKAQETLEEAKATLQQLRTTFDLKRQAAPARIHLDAYPEMLFSGKLEEMAPIARSGDFSPKLRTFSVVFSIDGNDARLMPDLSVGVDVNPATQVGGAGAFP